MTTTRVADLPGTEVREGDFLGHPKGLSYLFMTELWERYGHYGLLALLVLYMVNYLFQPGHVEQVLFYTPIKAGFESVFGPLGIQAFASQVYGVFIGLVYFAPFFGGIVADRLLGQRKSVIWGAAFMAAGYFMLGFEPLFFLSFPALIVGNGLFKPNISTQVANLYEKGDPRHDRAFSIFYVGINIGGVLGPFICGYLGERVGWAYGFISVGVGLVLALVIYLYGLRYVPQDNLTRSRVQHVEHKPLTPSEKKAAGALIILTALSAFFWAAWYLQFNTMNLWADVHTDRDIDLFGWHATIPTTWFQMVNGFYIFGLTPIVTSIWARQAARGREPTTVVKMAIGCFLLSASFLFMLIPVALLGPDGRTGMIWLILFYGIYTAGELYVSPVGLALVTKVAPPRIVSMMMGVWFIAYFIGGYLAGLMGSYWEAMSMSRFFVLVALVPALAGAAIWAFNRPLKPILQEKRSYV
ncbi:MAG TPA: peptide MFS transporter [Alphaproteobacteria bacterium]|nr:peptide MFS transporter [Alphaproteobacteria bacterium]